MRERKFKIWDTENNVMISMCDIPFEIICNMQEFLELILGGCDDRYIPLDYTGLLDKNKVEIYEGDIIYSNGLATFVKFYEGAYVSWSNEYEVDLNQCNKTIEVIGNIYENPELLEEK